MDSGPSIGKEFWSLPDPTRDEMVANSRLLGASTHPGLGNCPPGCRPAGARTHHLRNGQVDSLKPQALLSRMEPREYSGVINRHLVLLLGEAACQLDTPRSEEHTSELQSLMRIS